MTKLRPRPEIEIWSDLLDVEHPWITFPDPCGPARILIDDKLYRIILEPIGEVEDQ